MGWYFDWGSQRFDHTIASKPKAKQNEQLTTQSVLPHVIWLPFVARQGDFVGQPSPCARLYLPFPHLTIHTNELTHTGTMSQSLNEKQKLLQEALYLRTRVSVFINWKWVFFLSLVVLSFPLGCALFLFTV
jgi:hypothetical protein